MRRMDAIQADPPDVLVHVKVVPGASRTRIAGLLGDRIKIAVAAPPEKGKANAALTEFVAGLCNLRQRDVAVIAGETNPLKTLRLRNADIEQVRMKLSVK